MQRWRRRRAQGHVIVVRYADDMVVGFQYLADAHRFLAELKQRLEAFALELHPDKTRIIEFGRFAHEDRRARGQGKPETFAFMGFTHIFGRTREGRRLIRRHTVRERLNAKLRQVKATLRGMMHMPIPEQGALSAAGAERLLQLLRRSAPTSAPSIPSIGTSCATGSTASGGAASGIG
jgi:RNA-directed DNA polymerase